MNKIIGKAIDILVEAGTKRQYAEDEFKILSNPVKEAQRIIDDEELAKGWAEDLNFVNEG